MDDGDQWFGEAPVGVEIRDGTSSAEDHDPLHHRSEEEEGEGYADYRVDDAKGFTAV